MPGRGEVRSLKFRQKWDCHTAKMPAGLERAAKTRIAERRRWIWDGVEKGKSKECVGEEERGQQLVMRMEVLSGFGHGSGVRRRV